MKQLGCVKGHAWFQRVAEYSDLLAYAFFTPVWTNVSDTKLVLQIHQSMLYLPFESKYPQPFKHNAPQSL